MTVQAHVSGQTQAFTFIPRDFDVFAGLDVDHHQTENAAEDRNVAEQ
jgi:hypothetical protein